MGQTRISILDEVSKVLSDGDKLCLQRCVYAYCNGTAQIFFRFIRRAPNGNLKAQRGQAGFEDLSIASALLADMDKKIKV